MAEQLLRHGAYEYAKKVFDDIRAFSVDEPGVSRQGYGPKEQMVHDYMIEQAKQLDLEVFVDKCGNLFLTLPGEDRSLPALMTGSHGDSVPQGGHYDGLAGVVAAMTTMWWMRQVGHKPKRDITMLVTRMEESSWFGKAYVGSLAMVGQLEPIDLELKHRYRDETLREAIASLGFDPEAMVNGEPSVDLKKFCGFIELHIEQGPTLDSHEKERVGVVTGIRGNLRHKECHVWGETAHSGAVNKEYRHDAGMAMGEFLMSMEKHWEEWLEKGEDLVFTVGVMKTDPSSAIAIIPGHVQFSIDMRSLSMDTLARFHKLMEEEGARIGAKRGVKFEFDRTLVCEASGVDPDLMGHIAKTAERCEIPHIHMPSGAGHDAAVYENVGIPVAMIFVANQDGSHNWREKMKLEDFMLGTELLFKSIESYDD